MNIVHMAARHFNNFTDNKLGCTDRKESRSPLIRSGRYLEPILIYTSKRYIGRLDTFCGGPFLLPEVPL